MKFEASDLKFGVAPAFLKSLPAGVARFRPCGASNSQSVKSSIYYSSRTALEAAPMVTASSKEADELIERKEGEGKKGGPGLNPP